MAFTLKLEQPDVVFTVLSNKPVDLMNTVVIGLLQDIYSMHRAVRLSFLEISRPVERENTYQYLIVLEDTRRWLQMLFFQGGKVAMTFSVADHWELSEFALQRPIRDGIVRVVQDFEVTKLSAVFAGGR